MGKVVAIVNQKGGVGKTTTCVNMCAMLKKRGRRVLLVDADPQGNASSGLGVGKYVRPNCLDMLVKGVPYEKCVTKTEYCDVLSSNRELSGASTAMYSMERREFIMKNALMMAKMDYDYILIDCPPSLDLLTVNALVAADSVLIPVQCEYYALEGIADLMMTVKLAKKRLNPPLKVQGIVLTMFDSRTNFSEQVAEEVKKFFGDDLYKTRIPRNIRLAEAPSHGKPGVAYDRFSRGSRAYMHLADEFLKREEM